MWTLPCSIKCSIKLWRKNLSIATSTQTPAHEAVIVDLEHKNANVLAARLIGVNTTHICILYGCMYIYILYVYIIHRKSIVCCCACKTENTIMITSSLNQKYVNKKIL